MSQQNGGTIEDQRDQLVQQLSQLVGVSISQSSDGEVITTANGSPAGDGRPVLPAADHHRQRRLPAGAGLERQQHHQRHSGRATGRCDPDARSDDPRLPELARTLASQFATAFNSAQAQGYDSNGNRRPGVLQCPRRTAGAAAAIKVALTSGSQIAVSSDGTAGATATSQIFRPRSPTRSLRTIRRGAYASLVYDVGNAASNPARNRAQSVQNLLQLTNQQSSVSGVSIDEETTNLIRYQTAYEAAARIVSTIQALSTATINMVSSQSDRYACELQSRSQHLADLQQSQPAVNIALAEVSTGKRVTQPSDDPGASAAMVQNGIDTANHDQYTQNITTLQTIAQAASSSLSSVPSLTQAVSLGTEGANGTNSASNLQALAGQVQGILAA